MLYRLSVISFARYCLLFRTRFRRDLNPLSLATPPIRAVRCIHIVFRSWFSHVLQQFSVAIYYCVLNVYKYICCLAHKQYNPKKEYKPRNYYVASLTLLHLAPTFETCSAMIDCIHLNNLAAAGPTYRRCRGYRGSSPRYVLCFHCLPPCCQVFQSDVHDVDYVHISSS